MTECGFLICCYFFGIFLPGLSMNGIWDYNFFLSFSAYLISFWLKIRSERGFLIFCYFFRNFLALVDYEWKSVLKFFSRFLGLSHHVLGRNNAWKRFFYFFEFFCHIFRNFLARVEYERNSGLKFFFSLSRPISSRFG